MLRPPLRTPAIAATAFCAGVVVTVVVAMLPRHPTTTNGQLLRDETTDYAFVKPLLACNVGATEMSYTLNALKNTLTNIVDTATADGRAEHVSVFYRNLDSGEWTGVDVDDSYAPASLMKVPILMTYLAMEQRNGDVGDEAVRYTSDSIPTDEAQSIPPDVTLTVGNTYTVDELLDIMTTYSDNRARDVLMEYVDVATLAETLEDLGIPLPNGDADAYTVSPRLYSRLFRILYNATYLWPGSSERALHMLSRTTYDDGLRADIPTDVTIAHKFGEATFTRDDGSTGRELHDCGIVYTDAPYTICVMTKGTDTTTLASVVAELSNAAYDFSTRP